MSGYHLCQVKKARHPYFIESISTNIFTIEELCFYLEKNIYLLDQTIINEKLLDWIRDELGLVRLYRKLYEQLENEETIGNFILPIFKEIGYLSHDEFRELQEKIRTIEIQPEDLRRKIKADYLVEYHMYNLSLIHISLESIAYQVHDVLDAMRADSGISLSELKVDGGASANNFLMQSQADIINAPVNRPKCVETTAMGAAYLAGLAVGYWKDQDEIRKNWAIDRTFTPAITEEERAKKLKGWNKAVKYALHWAKDEE